MSMHSIQIVIAFTADDQAWIRRSGLVVPDYWGGHTVAPALDDVLRLGGRQFTIQARVWEHDGATPLLRLYVASGRAESDTTFG